jgi:hypothetical protein
VYEKVERIFLIILNYLKQKADTCTRNGGRIRLDVSYHRRAGWRLATNWLPSRDGARPLANQSVRGGSRVDAASKKKYAFACFLFVATSHAILPCTPTTPPPNHDNAKAVVILHRSIRPPATSPVPHTKLPAEGLYLLQQTYNTHWQNELKFSLDSFDFLVKRVANPTKFPHVC